MTKCTALLFIYTLNLSPSITTLNSTTANVLLVSLNPSAASLGNLAFPCDDWLTTLRESNAANCDACSGTPSIKLILLEPSRDDGKRFGPYRARDSQSE